MDLLTTAEAADYLRLKERKLYELVSEGAIPCSKVTGKSYANATKNLYDYVAKWASAGRFN
jgi:excisionase family DNA binding protein